MKRFPLLAALAFAPLVLVAHPGHDDDHDDHDHDHAPAAATAPAKAPAAHVHTHAEAPNPRVALSPLRRANLRLETAPVAAGTIRKTAFALGVLVADPAGISAASVRIPGRVLEMRVALGDTVKKGDTLAVIEARAVGADRVPVVALADGTVDEVLAHVGDPVSADTPLLRLSDHKKLIAEARVPQSVVAKLVARKTRASFTPEGGVERELTLDSLAPVADAQAGVVIARFRPDNADGSLAAGRRAAFRLILEEKDYPVTVPGDAVQGDGGDLYVFVEEKTGIYEKHPVIVIDRDDRRVAVTGPDAGERVVSQGAYSLRYADTGNLSLREAMDIAHGHKHGPNGEEPGEVKGAAHTHDHDDHDHDHDDHDHDHDDHDHDHDHGTTKPAAAGEKKPGENAALVAAMDAAHGHKHGPNGEEPGEEHDKGSNTPGLFTGDSGALFFGTIAAGEAVLLALAVNALRRRKKDAADA